jgi:predicted house-cleaning noncanonical NTP pyrophosphatase (MazG superfamily)
LQEECAEFVTDHSIAELADIVEVVHALTKCIGSTAEEVEAVRVQKATERKAFTQKIYLERVVE